MLEEDWMEWVPMVGLYEIPLDLARGNYLDIKLRDGAYERGYAGELEWDASQEEPDTDIVAYRKIT